MDTAPACSIARPSYCKVPAISARPFAFTETGSQCCHRLPVWPPSLPVEPQRSGCKRPGEAGCRGGSLSVDSFCLGTPYSCFTGLGCAA